MKKIDKRFWVLITLIMLVLIPFIILTLQKNKEYSTGTNTTIPELLSPTPTLAVPIGTEKEDFVAEEFQTKPKKAYDYKLSNDQTITIYIPEDVNPPPVAVVEEMVRSSRK